MRVGILTLIDHKGPEDGWDGVCHYNTEWETLFYILELVRKQKPQLPKESYWGEVYQGTEQTVFRRELPV